MPYRQATETVVPLGVIMLEILHAEVSFGIDVSLDLRLRRRSDTDSPQLTIICHGTVLEASHAHLCLRIIRSIDEVRRILADLKGGRGSEDMQLHGRRDSIFTIRMRLSST